MEFYNLFMEKTNIAFAILKPFARIHNVGEGLRFIPCKNINTHRCVAWYKSMLKLYCLEAIKEYFTDYIHIPSIVKPTSPTFARTTLFHIRYKITVFPGIATFPSYAGEYFSYKIYRLNPPYFKCINKVNTLSSALNS